MPQSGPGLCGVATPGAAHLVTLAGVALGKGKTEHAGARDMSRKHGHWGLTEEAKAWATRALRRDEREQLRDELAEVAHLRSAVCRPDTNSGTCGPA
jgi:hypothetical protein